MRSKETAGDYRYFPDPNIMPVVIDDEWFDGIKATLPELPEVKRAKYIDEMGLSEYDADQLVSSRALCDVFEDAVAVCGSAKESANWIITDCMQVLNKKKMTADMLAINGTSLGQLIKLVSEDKVSRGNAKRILAAMFENDIADVEAYAKKHFEKSVRKTLTIPAWLNAAALEQGINFSQTLQEALLAKVQAR